jgi:predicted DCC family thiol-disulfide oxidoreductase YuxK
MLQRSDAALEIAKQLSGLWPCLYIFKILPRFFRDGVYNWIAQNRYRWFGKKDACWLPSPELKSRFID